MQGDYSVILPWGKEGPTLQSKTYLIPLSYKDDSLVSKENVEDACFIIIQSVRTNDLLKFRITKKT
jgi:hypothetical protein